MVDKLLQEKQVSFNRQRKEVDILIGLDFYLEMLGQVNTLKLANGLHLHLTDCGPIVSGKEKVVMDIERTLTTIAMDSLDDHKELVQLLSQFWSLESIGIVDVDPKTKAVDEANHFYQQTTTRNPDGRYVVRLSYTDKNQLSSNRELAYYRLQGTLKRLSKDSNMMTKYAAIFEEQLKLGFIELVVDEAKVDGEVVHYLSHHPIIKESSKSTKVRIVFDGSAKRGKGRSLNDHLHTGERLLPDIVGVLLRIRQAEILISADLEKAFLQLELHMEDRDATRFLWSSPETSELQCYRFKRVPFGLKPSPYLLNASIKDLLTTDDPIAQRMLRSIYVDNVYVGVSSVDEAKEFYTRSKTIFAEAQMNLCQFVSNCQEANAYFTAQENSKPEDDDQKLLGVKWNTRSDCLSLGLPNTSPELLTRRKTLKYIASCYDPLGILTPVTLSGKLFLQELNKEETKAWDLPLSKEQHGQWKKIMDQWSGDEWCFPRQFFPMNGLNGAIRKELHVFTDASKVAYGAVAYLRILVQQSQPDTAFLMAKSRVSPMKNNYSIPQLEILALLTGVRLAHYCLQELDLDLDGVFVWSDSMCSLDSLQSTNATGSRFVKNRVKQILELSEDLVLSHVPGKINPADLLTRGCSFEELKSNKLWSNGPEFLKSNENLPIRKFSTDVLHRTTTNYVAAFEPTIDTERFGSFHRLLRMVMILVAFMSKGKLHLRERVDKARIIIYRLAQKQNPPSEDTIKSLRMAVDSETSLWLYTGRVMKRRLIYIPQGHVAQLLILDEHWRNHHSSPLFTLTQLRLQFWIPHGRSYVKRILSKCKGCAKLDAQPYCQKPFAAFPDSRISPSMPFKHTGLDYAGPLKITINNTVHQIWFVLFTCLYSRFVATEIVMDLTSVTFLNALRRFSAMFGSPSTVVCDNAAQLKLMDEVVQLVHNQQQGSSVINSTSLPEFHFIPAHSPWAGGVYERMIGLVKRALTRAGATKTLMELDDFRTTLAECTAIVNCRPVSYVSAEDNIKPLRPIDFVFPHGRVQSESLLMLYEKPDAENISSTRSNLMSAWEQLSTITDDFQRRWNKEYVQVLQERADFVHKQRKGKPFEPSIGDVVIIGQPSEKSSKWPLGRIVEVKERSAVVKNGRTKKLNEYPWKMLYPLETDLNFQTNLMKKSTENNGESTMRQDMRTNVTPTQQESIRIEPRRSPRVPNATTFLSMLTLMVLASTTTATETTMIVENRPEELVASLRWWMMGLLAIGVCYGLHLVMTIVFYVGSAMLTTWKIGSYVAKGTWQGGQLMWKRWPYHKIKTASVVMVLLLCWIPIMDGCDTIASIQATDDVCTLSKNGTSCSLNTISILNVRPNGSTACYRIRNEDRQLETVVEIRAESILSTCHETTHHFQRDFKIEHEWSHRCSGAGSCKGERCEQLQETDSVPEFSSTSMNAPGFSRCFASCGCVTCGGCFLCSPSCLFSRLFAVPTSDNIYEVITCGAWSTTIELHVSINGKGQKFYILHGVRAPIAGTNITVIVTGFATPPAPVHGATFIKRYSKTGNKTTTQVGYSYTSVAQAGAPTRGFVGEFQCPTADSARNFDCIFDESLCQCISKGTSVVCGCKNIDLNGIITKTLLPHYDGGIMISMMNNIITTRTTTAGLVSVQLDFRNQSIHRIVKDDVCQADQIKLEGCYSCGSGAELKLSCSSTTNNKIEATLQCQSMLEFVSCSTTGTSNLVKVFTNQPMFAQNCSVQCGKKVQYLMIEGQLKEQVLFDSALFNKKFVSFHEFVDGESIMGSIGNFVDGIWTAFTALVGRWVVYGLLVLVVVIICLQCSPFIWCRQCRNRRKHHTSFVTRRSRWRRQ